MAACEAQADEATPELQVAYDKAVEELTAKVAEAQDVADTQSDGLSEERAALLDGILSGNAPDEVPEPGDDVDIVTIAALNIAIRDAQDALALPVEFTTTDCTAVPAEILADAETVTIDVVDGITPAPAELQTLVTTLDTAMTDIATEELRVANAALASKIESAETTLADTKDEVKDDATRTALETEIEAAKAILADEAANIDEVKAATKSLNDAINVVKPGSTDRDEVVAGSARVGA